MRLRLLLCILILAGRVFGGEISELSSKELTEARRLYNSKCSRCHKFYNPSLYHDAEWQDWMEKMRKKSKLKNEQFDLLMRYTELLRRNQKPEQPDRVAVSKQKS